MSRVPDPSSPVFRSLTRSGAAGLLAMVLLLIAAPARAAGMLVADGGLGGQLEIKEHNVRVTINNGVAVTEVTQIFRNTEDRQVEALYTFPVPRAASVSNFSMWINGKEMVGEVLEKKKAREIYDSYKKVRRDPGLLEQADFKTFEMRIFPIAPRAEQKVQVTYYQELDVDHDWATYVYPLATTTRREINTKARGKFSVSFDVKSQVPIAAMESTSHAKEFAIAKHTEGYYQASLETREGDLNRDVVVAFHLARPRTGIDLIASKQGNEDGYFALTLTEGEELAAMEAGMDYVFVLDISGSMNDDGKLDLSRNSLGAFIQSLGKDDRFDVMTFNVQAHPFFKSLMAADEGNKKKAAEFLASQEARGGTKINPALSTAYKYADEKRTLNVVILSDGLTEDVDARTLMELIKSRPTNSRVFSIGVGNDVNKPLLENVAEQSGGLAAFLSRGDDFARQAQAFRRKLMHPVATDLKIGITGVEVYDLEPKSLPSLYHGTPVRLYGRYKGGGAAKVAVGGNLAGQKMDQAVPVDFPRQDGQNPEIERMWAQHRLQRLLKEADASGSRAAVLDEVVRLGEGYSIASEYTSFIVLENDGEYQRWNIERKNALRLGRDRTSQQELRTKLEAMKSSTEGLGPEAVAPKQLAIAPTNSASPMNDPSPAPTGPRDLTVPGFGRGAGVIDPVTAMFGIGLAAMALALRKRRAA